MNQCFSWCLNPTHISDVMLSKRITSHSNYMVKFQVQVINPKSNVIKNRGPIICLKWPIISIQMSPKTSCQNSKWMVRKCTFIPKLWSLVNTYTHKHSINSKGHVKMVGKINRNKLIMMQPEGEIISKEWAKIH